MRSSFLRFFAFILFFVSVPALSFAVTAPEPLGTFSIPVSYKSLNLRVMGGGTVAADPMPVNGVYPEGTVVHLTATADTGYNFTGWGDPALGTTTSIDVTMDSDKTLVATFSAPPALHAGDIATVAGNGYYRFAGDGGPATEAYLGFVVGVAVDAAGNIYISDPNNNSVRKVDTNGIITTIAGTNQRGYSGDGGPAWSAMLCVPWDLTADAAGNLFVQGGNVPDKKFIVRKIGTDGTITAYAGNGTDVFSGDGGPATAAGFAMTQAVALDNAGALYISDINRIRKVDVGGTVTTVVGNGNEWNDGVESAPEINTAHGIAVDLAENIYVTDRSCVRKADTSGNMTIFADGFSLAEKLAFDLSGNLFVTDYFDFRVYKVDPDKNKTLFAGTGFTGSGMGGYSGDGGPAVDAEFSIIRDVASDAAGNIYIADQQNHVVRKVDTGGIVTTVAGVPFGPVGDGGPAKDASMGPWRIAFDPSGQLHILDVNCIRKVDSNGVITTVAGNGRQGFSGDGGPAISASMNYPADIVFDSTGNLYISDGMNGRVRKVDVNGIITTVAGNGNLNYTGDGDSALLASLAPYSVLPDKDGNLFIADFINRVIRMVDKDGIISTVAGDGTTGYSGDGGPAILAQLSQPKDLTFDADGNLTFIDGVYIRAINADGIINTVANVTEGTLSGIATDLNGNFIISDVLNNCITMIDPAGNKTRITGSEAGFSGDGGPALSADFLYPMDVAIDNAGNIYIADNGNNRVRMILKSSLYTLGINSTTGSTATCDPVKEFYTEGDHVTITAVPSSDLFVFTGWSGDATGSVNPLDVTMDGNKTITANFVPSVYRLNVVASPSGAGSFQITPASPDGNYAIGTKVQIKVIPAPGYMFTGFAVAGGKVGDVELSGDTVNVTMTDNISVTAAFALKGGINLSITQKGTNITYNVEYFAGGVPQTNKPIKLYSKLKTATSWTLKATVYTSNGSVSKTLALSNGNYNLKAEYAPTFSKITRSNSVDCLVAPVVVPPQGVTNPSVTPDSTPNLQWSAFTGATGYYLQTCANSTFAPGTYVQSPSLGNVTNADLPVALPMGIKRYWRVVAQLPTGWSVPSAARYITYKEGTSFSGLSANASGNTIQPSVTLVGADGGDTSGKTVTFYYKKGSATTWNTATAVTDVSGFARIATPKTLTNGSYQLYVKFAGDASYAAVTSAKIPFTLPAP